MILYAACHRINLGPLLFILYINDLPLSLLSSYFIIFADDTNILFPIKTLSN